MSAFIFGLFGLIIGSFLNVVILRRGSKSLGGRSGCLSCGGALHARELIPVVSWLFLRGRCRRCGSAVSVQYPLVEITTAALFALVGGAPLLLPTQLLACVIACFFVLIAAYDLRHTIIPDEWAYGAALFALVFQFVLPFHASPIPALLAGPVAALPLFALWFVSRGRWMGLGDSKLALSIGWLLGPLYGIEAIFYAFIFGAVISLVVLVPLPYYARLARKAGIVRRVAIASYTMKSEVPFGPFLILACLFVWFATLYSIALPALF